jgi:hypothetical protein
MLSSVTAGVLIGGSISAGGTMKDKTIRFLRPTKVDGEVKKTDEFMTLDARLATRLVGSNKAVFEDAPAAPEPEPEPAPEPEPKRGRGRS